MRVRSYDFTGRPVWIDEGPSFARLPGWSGEMIRGAPGGSDRDVARHRERQRLLESRIPLKADYQARAAKGWATRKGIAPPTGEA